MAKNKDQKKKAREKRVAQKKLEDAARRRAAQKAEAENSASGVMSKKIRTEAAAREDFKQPVTAPRKNRS